MNGRYADAYTYRVSTHAEVSLIPDSEFLTDAESRDIYARSEVRQSDTRTGRYALKQLIVDTLAEGNIRTSCHAFEIVYTPHGQPIARSTDSQLQLKLEQLSISVTHSRGFAVATVAKSDENAVGIDFEFIRDIKSTTIEAFLSASEWVLYATLPEDEKVPFAISRWCLKEAYGKATGRGLQQLPRTITCSGIDDSITIFDANLQVTCVRAWTRKINGGILARVAFT